MVRNTAQPSGSSLSGRFVSSQTIRRHMAYGGTRGTPLEIQGHLQAPKPELGPPLSGSLADPSSTRVARPPGAHGETDRTMRLFKDSVLDSATSDPAPCKRFVAHRHCQYVLEQHSAPCLRVLAARTLNTLGGSAGSGNTQSVTVCGLVSLMLLARS